MVAVLLTTLEGCGRCDQEVEHFLHSLLDDSLHYLPVCRSTAVQQLQALLGLRRSAELPNSVRSCSTAAGRQGVSPPHFSAALRQQRLTSTRRRLPVLSEAAGRRS